MKPKNMTFVNSLAQLEEICRIFEKSEWLALDTEFLRETTYYSKFCLLQIANSDHIACIDPLALKTLEPLRKLLFNPKVTKIFHAGRQDLEIFYNIFEAVPSPIFDTQIAAPLLGFGDQIGYAALVSEIIGVHLEKAHSRTDWTVRPLSDEQLKYACDDVVYLAEIYRKILERLLELGRLDWLQEDFEAQINPNLYNNRPDQAWKRIRGTNRLSDIQLTVLQVVAEWRETVAQQKNKPRNWIFRDDFIIDLAKLRPECMDALTKIRGLSDRAQKDYGKHLCSLVQKAKTIPLATNGRGKKLPKKALEQDAILDLLTAVVRLRAAENSLSPSVLASKKDLEQLLVDPKNTKILHGWRKNLIGDDLLETLAGKRTISVTNGAIRIDNCNGLQT